MTTYDLPNRALYKGEKLLRQWTATIGDEVKEHLRSPRLKTRFQYGIDNLITHTAGSAFIAVCLSLSILVKDRTKSGRKYLIEDVSQGVGCRHAFEERSPNVRLTQHSLNRVNYWPLEE
jgi:hypothetical protein